jgi:DNA polymerase I-like protein with 3'-5' exonuclease and polymerase domains
VGIEYVPTKKLAGFRLKDPGFVQVGYNGYSVDKEALSFYIDSTDNLEAKAFMTKLIRLNAVNAYLSNYVDGIERRLMSDNRVHPKFNQTITATGRLSSSKPNFQNMPRAGTFPIKRSIVSRFDGGLILEGDFAQLEFRVAGYLAEDDLIREDVVNEVDVHTVTADIIFGPWEGEGKHPQRQDAKAHTFKPLYGGTTGTPDQTRYYKHFLENYDRVADWHEELKETALVDKSITLPSGRKLNYPYVKREPWGISHGTTIKNWPVQSYATADLLPISLVYLHNKLRGMKSMIINTVHDSIVLDVHPDEVDEVVEIFKEAMECLPDETERRFGVRYDMPVGYDVKLGENWMELEEVYETNG